MSNVTYRPLAARVIALLQAKPMAAPVVVNDAFRELFHGVESEPEDEAWQSDLHLDSLELIESYKELFELPEGVVLRRWFSHPSATILIETIVSMERIMQSRGRGF